MLGKTSKKEEELLNTAISIGIPVEAELGAIQGKEDDHVYEEEFNLMFFINIILLF